MVKAAKKCTQNTVAKLRITKFEVNEIMMVSLSLKHVVTIRNHDIMTESNIYFSEAFNVLENNGKMPTSMWSYCMRYFVTLYLSFFGMFCQMENCWLKL